MTTTSPVRVERRVGQRFPYLLPVSVRHPSQAIEIAGFTQDVSSRGVFFFTDAPLTEGEAIELTLQMPSEITLGESMLVRCRARVLRVAQPLPGLVPRASISLCAETKIGVAVRLDGYEYLPSDSCATFARVSSLHSDPEKDRSLGQSSARP